MNCTIGFFGDSFCSHKYNYHSLKHKYTTYIDLLAKHYNAKIVNLGAGGSSVYDTILIQLQPLIDRNQVPDICVFFWTNSGRLFHPKVRNINHASVKNYSPTIYNFLNKKVWQAAQMYYDHFYDYNKDELEYRALLSYIDNHIITKLPSSTKIVHLWSIGAVKNWGSDNFGPTEIEYPHTWSHGSEIKPALISLSLYDTKKEILSADTRCNHLDGQYKNDLVYEWIKLAIDNPNSYWDHSGIVSKLHTHS